MNGILFFVTSRENVYCSTKKTKRVRFCFLIRVFWSFVFFLIVNDFLLLSTDGNGGHCGGILCLIIYILMYLRVCIHPSRLASKRCVRERRIQRRELLILSRSPLFELFWMFVFVFYVVWLCLFVISTYIYTRLKQEVHRSLEGLFDTESSLSLSTLNEEMDFTNMPIETKASRHARLLSHRRNVLFFAPVQGIFLAIVSSMFQMLMWGERRDS